MMEVVVLKEGVKERSLKGGVVCRDPLSSSVTLIKTNVNVVVDTGCRSDARLILDRIGEEGVSPDVVDYVVNTHWHPDHTSNNHLFENAKIIIGESTWLPHANANHGSWEDAVRDMKGVEIVRTPGHTPLHISVIANADRRYVLAGDAFFEEDLKGGKASDTNSDLNRFKDSVLGIIRTADVIIPGHGRTVELDGEARTALLNLAEKLE